MKIVSADEAVAGIRSGDQVYVQCAAAPALGPPRRPRRPRPRAPRRERRPPPHRGPRAPPRAGDGAALPPPRPVHRPQRPRRRRTRAGPSTSRSSCRTCRASSSGRAAAARRGPLQRLAARRARLLLAGHLGRGDAGGRSSAAGRSSPSSTRRCRGPSARASSTSTTSTTGGRGRRAALRLPAREPSASVERRIGELRGRPGPGRGDAPDGDRGDPDRRGAHSCATRRTLASTPR